MGFHLPFFLAWRTKMVAEAEDSEDESYAIDCPVLVTERLVMRAPRAR